jgi:4-amino-4-deoxy-L-arabinose transferase-like glycosyltransferase
LWFFVPVLLGTMLPWSFFIPTALFKAWRDRHHDEGQAGMYLLIWTALIFLFFSKSNSKLIPYILPIFPSLAMLIGHRIDVMSDGRGREMKWTAITLGLVLAALGAAVLGYARLPQAVSLLIGQFPGWSVPLTQFVRHAPSFSLAASVTLGGLFLFQGIGILKTAGRNPMAMVVVLCLGSFVLEILVPWMIMPQITRAESPQELSMKAAALAGPASRIVTYGPMQAVSWYTGRRVLVTGDRDELDFGSRQGDQSAWFPDQPALLKLWSEKHVLLFLKKGELEKLQPLLDPRPVVKGKAGRRILISNR